LFNIYYKLPALASKQEGNQARQAIKSLALPTLTTCAHKLQSSPRYYGYATIIQTIGSKLVIAFNLLKQKMFHLLVSNIVYCPLGRYQLKAYISKLTSFTFS